MTCAAFALPRGCSRCGDHLSRGRGGSLSCGPLPVLAIEAALEGRSRNRTGLVVLARNGSRCRAVGSPDSGGGEGPADGRAPQDATLEDMEAAWVAVKAAERKAG